MTKTRLRRVTSPFANEPQLAVPAPPHPAEPHAADWFTDFIENAGDIIYEHDMSGRFTYINRAVEQVSGYSRDQLLRMNVVQLFTRREMVRAADRISRLFAGEEEGEERSLYERELVASDGRRIVLEVCARVLYENGKPVRMQGVARDITQRKQDDEARARLAEMSASLQQKDLLIQEIHHRVKNNLQLIASLLNLQSYHVKDPDALERFRESQNRVRSLAFVHEALYRTHGLSQLDSASYLRDLTAHLLRSYQMSARVDVHVDVRDLVLHPDTAVTCGLIVNELVSNSLKHAFPGERRGEIHVTLHPDAEDRFVLEVRDDGCGFSTPIDAHESSTLGLQLVSSLTDQLDGTMECDGAHGAAFRFRLRERRGRKAA